MSMRVTSKMNLRSTMRELASSLDRLQTSQRRLSTGKAYERISDNPRTATDVIFMRGRLQRHDQIARTADDSKARLQLADTTLLGASDILLRANELAVRAANTGASGSDGRRAIAEEMRSLRDELLSAANSQYLGRSLFAGTAGGEAYDLDTGAYVGNDTVEFRTVAENVFVPGNITGPQVFGDPGDPSGDLFAIVDRLATAVDNDDVASIGLEQANLETARTRLGSALAEVGRRVAQIDDIQARGAVEREQLVDRLQSLENVDLAEAVIDVKTNESAYQAALAAAGRAMPPSLVDYLR